MKRDSWSINPLWTAQERVDILTVRKAVENKVQDDPHHSKAFDLMGFNIDFLLEVCVLRVLSIPRKLWPF